MSVDYKVADVLTGIAADQLTAQLNGYGTDGWRLVTVSSATQAMRRGTFIQSGATVEYLVLDYPTGKATDELESYLDGYGADGWGLIDVDQYDQRTRRVIMLRPYNTGGGGGGAGIPEAPSDNTTYGRRNTSWNPALARDNDTLDGGSF
jgi:hypothetical protein